MRLDKFLADARSWHRSQVKTIIRKGTITVNGVPAKKPEQSVNPETDQICDGSPGTDCREDGLLYVK